MDDLWHTDRTGVTSCRQCGESWRAPACACTCPPSPLGDPQPHSSSSTSRGDLWWQSVEGIKERLAGLAEDLAELRAQDPGDREDVTARNCRIKAAEAEQKVIGRIADLVSKFELAEKADYLAEILELKRDRGVRRAN